MTSLTKDIALILLLITTLFIMGCITELIRPHNEIFEASKTILPPIATLVIGFYFGRNN